MLAPRPNTEKFLFDPARFRRYVTTLHHASLGIDAYVHANDPTRRAPAFVLGAVVGDAKKAGAITHPRLRLRVHPIEFEHVLVLVQGNGAVPDLVSASVHPDAETLSDFDGIVRSIEWVVREANRLTPYYSRLLAVHTTRGPRWRLPRSQRRGCRGHRQTPGLGDWT